MSEMKIVNNPRIKTNWSIIEPTSHCLSLKYHGRKLKIHQKNIKNIQLSNKFEQKHSKLPHTLNLCKTDPYVNYTSWSIINYLIILLINAFT